MNVYMLSFTSRADTVTRQDILNYLDTRKEVLNWYAAMPFTIFLVSRETPTRLSRLLEERFRDDITFIIAKVVSQTIDGFINEPVWNFINQPKSSGKWE